MARSRFVNGCNYIGYSWLPKLNCIRQKLWKRECVRLMPLAVILIRSLSILLLLRVKLRVIHKWYNFCGNLLTCSERQSIVRLLLFYFFIVDLFYILEKIFYTIINLQEVWHRWRIYKAIEYVSFMNNCSLKLMVANCQCLTVFRVIYSQRHCWLPRSLAFVYRSWEKAAGFHSLVQIFKTSN
jgi:hypothetical protein